jgi:transposase
MPTRLPTIEIDMSTLEDALRRAEERLDEKDYAILKAVVDAYDTITELVDDKNTTIARLRKLLFGAKTEKTSAILGTEKDVGNRSAPGDAEPVPESPSPSSLEAEADATAKDGSESSGNGHGRNGAEAYTGAEQIEVRHKSLEPGDACPDCGQGTLYETARRGVLVRIVGQAPMQAKVYYLEKLRCHLCGKVFTAQLPEGTGGEKYDPTVGSMIALLKYGSGMPFNRLERLQGTVGIPLPASTQWDIVHESAEHAEPVFEELIRQAAQGEVLYNDDTNAKILEWMGKRAQAIAKAEGSAKGRKNKAEERKGLFTSGIVSTREGRRIALFFSGRKHAGENLNDVLSRRTANLGAPIQMCDALSRNLPAELETIVANCLAHGRRQFVDVADRFPTECRHVLEAIAVIYKNDALASERNLSPEARLEFHQTESGPIMAELQAWLKRQFDERLVEPNSALGEAISYLLKHWEKLTLFLRHPGAPLDNNICERILKKAILHRKNALFYKTSRGAHVGDIFMSLIHTCELCGANAFDYLTELDRHSSEVALHPQGWTPWAYRLTTDAAAPIAGPTP